MSAEPDPEVVERMMAQLRDFAHGLGLDEAKARQIVDQVIVDMPLHTDEERLVWASNWMRAASSSDSGIHPEVT